MNFPSSGKIALFPVCILCSLFALFSCGNDTGQAGDIPGRREIRELVLSLSPAEKAAQVLMTGIGGKDEFPAYLYAHFRGRIPGAVLLFRYNIADTPEGVSSYLSSCDRAFDSLGAPVPVLYAIDHEGGDVYRTGKVTTRLPSARLVADTLSPENVARLYGVAGSQLAGLGIRMNLAPVGETLNASNDAFLGTRAFSTDEKKVADCSRAAVEGYRSAGVLTVLKHFPGNGSGDPHTGLPRIDLSRADFEKECVAPFKAILKSRKNSVPDAVLVSHIVVTAVESGTPFCLSRAGVTGLLRNTLGFRGVILTDDIAMGALARNGYDSRTAAVRALEAGCDMVMTSEPDIAPVIRAIMEKAASDPSFASALDRSVERIIEMKCCAGLVKKAGGGYTAPTVFDAALYAEKKLAGDRILEEYFGN